MKKYPEHSPAADKLEDAPLEFPVAANLNTRPAQVEFHAMLKRIEENMPWRNRRPGEAQRRLEEKIPVEFVL
jgi:hypothetical protein